MRIRSFDHAVFRDNTVDLLAHGPIASTAGPLHKKMFIWPKVSRKFSDITSDDQQLSTVRLRGLP